VIHWQLVLMIALLYVPIDQSVEEVRLSCSQMGQYGFWEGTSTPLFLTPLNITRTYGSRTMEAALGF
jgi:hypothetical protein